MDVCPAEIIHQTTTYDNLPDDVIIFHILQNCQKQHAYMLENKMTSHLALYVKLSELVSDSKYILENKETFRQLQSTGDEYTDKVIWELKQNLMILQSIWNIGKGIYESNDTIVLADLVKQCRYRASYMTEKIMIKNQEKR